MAATEEQYRAVNAALETHASPPAGLIMHSGGPVGDGPAISEVMGDDAPRASVEIRELFDVIVA